MGKASLIATAICLTLLRTTSSFSSMQPRAAVAATTCRQRGPFAGGSIQSTTCRRSERSRLRMSDAAAAPKKGFVEKVRWKSMEVVLCLVNGLLKYVQLYIMMLWLIEK